MFQFVGLGVLFVGLSPPWRRDCTVQCTLFWIWHF